MQLVIAQWWSEIIGASDDKDHCKYGTKVIDCERKSGGLGALLGYLVKEQTKITDGGKDMPTGRCWGSWGDLPTKDLGTYDLTEREYEEFCKRVNDLGQGRSWYLDSISPRWAGFTILAGPDQVATLMDGLGERVCDDDVGDNLT